MLNKTTSKSSDADDFDEFSFDAVEAASDETTVSPKKKFNKIFIIVGASGLIICGVFAYYLLSNSSSNSATIIRRTASATSSKAHTTPSSRVRIVPVQLPQTTIKDVDEVAEATTNTTSDLTADPMQLPQSIKKPFKLDFSDTLVSVGESRILLENPFYAQRSAQVSEELNAQSLLLDEKIRLLGRVESYLKGVRKVQALQYSLQDMERAANPPAVIAAPELVSTLPNTTEPTNLSTSKSDLPEAFEALLDTSALFSELETQVEDTPAQVDNIPVTVEPDAIDAVTDSTSIIEVVPMSLSETTALLIPETTVPSETATSDVYIFPKLTIHSAYANVIGEVFLLFSDGTQLPLVPGAKLNDTWKLSAIEQLNNTLDLTFVAVDTITKHVLHFSL